MRQYVTILPTETVPAYSAPHLPALLQAAVAGQRLRITYESRAGRSERAITPFGLYASAGYWYCACHDDRRDNLLSLRADRVLAVATIDPGEAEGDRPVVPLLRDWLQTRWTGPSDPVALRLRVTAAARRQFDFTFLQAETGAIPEDGGQVEAIVPRGELDYYAAKLLPMGTSVQIEGPPELIALIRRRAEALVAHYRE